MMGSATVEKGKQMAEYIERKAAIDVIMSEPTDAHYPSWYADKIESISVADVEPVRHGRLGLVHIDEYFGNFADCLECGADNIIPCNYCRICGAKMGRCKQ